MNDWRSLPRTDNPKIPWASIKLSKREIVRYGRLLDATGMNKSDFIRDALSRFAKEEEAMIEETIMCKETKTQIYEVKTNNKGYTIWDNKAQNIAAMVFYSDNGDAERRAIICCAALNAMEKKDEN